jgi:transposase-like protein
MTARSLEKQTRTVEQESEARMTRGLQILEGKQIVENEDGSFAVSSQTSKASYEVRLLGQTWACTCPDFQYRQVEACKHIFAVRLQIAAKTYIHDEPKPKVFASDAIPCDRCGSIRVIHYGRYGSKAVFYCKDCKHKFRESSIVKTKFSPELVTMTLDLYFSGLSLRKIVRHLKDHFEIKIGSTTIYDWIAKYVPMIAEYANSQCPEMSKEWHADELFVKVRGGTHKGAGFGMVWNIMDRETRFLIVSKLTKDRSAIDTTAAFEEAQRNAHGIKPETVFTDSLRHYNIATKTVFPNAERVQNCGIAKRETNNRIERMNGTLRERVKVQRGWKTEKSVLAEGNRLQYNFVKPHMALEGQTPAQAAGLKVKGWNELMKAALSK